MNTHTHTLTLTDDELYTVIAGLKVRETRLLQHKRRAERIADKYRAGAVPPPDYKMPDGPSIVKVQEAKIAKIDRLLTASVVLRGYLDDAKEKQIL